MCLLIHVGININEGDPRHVGCVKEYVHVFRGRAQTTGLIRWYMPQIDTFLSIIYNALGATFNNMDLIDAF